jgi:seryl-tRNA(Sec) selenium transferase
MKDVEDVIGEHTGLSRKVLEYSLIMKRMVAEAKLPGFSQECWAPLAELIATDEFERVGNFKEVRNST